MTPDAVVAEAAEIQRLATASGIHLRLIGSLGIFWRCPERRGLFDPLGRRPPQDIDLIGYAKQERVAASLFLDRGYVQHPSVRHSREWGVNRLIYTHPEHGGKVDMFLDRLVMAHTIDFTGRLENEAVTVSVGDLLLSKLQIHRITLNDFIDLTVLLAEYDIAGGSDRSTLDRVRSVLSDDWGFAHGAKLNLGLLATEVRGFQRLDTKVRDLVLTRIARLGEAIERAPKSARWRLRARLGTRASWYEHVDDVDH